MRLKKEIQFDKVVLQDKKQKKNKKNCYSSDMKKKK